MTANLTASMLYDFVRCPQRVALDLFGDPARRDPVSPFVQMLWERGQVFELDIIHRLAVPYEDLKAVPAGQREEATLEAMASRVDLIYGGRISSGNLVGEPDILRRDATGYVAGDIKSGAGTEGGNEDSDGKPKTHYAVQLAFYTDILERRGILGGGPPFIWDVQGREVPYDLTSSRGPRIKQSMQEEYEDVMRQVSRIAAGQLATTPAACSECKLCHWRSLCEDLLLKADDLTLIPGLGRARRDKMLDNVGTVMALTELDTSTCSISGLGTATLEKFKACAVLQKTEDAKPYYTSDVSLPSNDVELYFDVETDPMRSICYLHGFIERTKSTAKERYVPFFAEQTTEEAEKQAFRDAWHYLQSKSPCSLFFYSAYEKTTWRQLAQKYPDVAVEAEVKAIFDSESALDLYFGLVSSKMIWPTHDLSIKTLARYLGFEWRDTDPSGAASIQWYNEWVTNGDEAIRQRILDYNEDDCVAMRVLFDFAKSLAADGTMMPL